MDFYKSSIIALAGYSCRTLVLPESSAIQTLNCHVAGKFRIARYSGAIRAR
jgi:hypothetical protein